MITIKDLNKFIEESKEIKILTNRIKMLYIENWELLNKIVKPKILRYDTLNDDYFNNHLGEIVILYHKFKGQVTCRIEIYNSYLSFRKISKNNKPKHTKYDPKYLYLDKELTNNIGRKQYEKVPVYEVLSLDIITENNKLEAQRINILSDLDKYSNELKSIINEYAIELYWIYSNGNKELMKIRYINIYHSKIEIEMSSAKSDTRTERCLTYSI